MKTFQRCYPDANNFNKVIKLTDPKSWKFEYIDLGQNIGYWVAENPFLDDGFEIFRELVAKFPIQKDNSHPENPDPNPFDTIHLPEWCYKDICFFLRDFYYARCSPNVTDPQIHEWGNVFNKQTTRPVACWRIPHVDYAHGIVANLWFTDHNIADSSTKFYKYHGNIINDTYDFQIEKNHRMHETWKEMAETPKRSDKWFNYTDDELADWGFEYLGEAPTREKTMSIYKSNTCHLAYISENVDFRWSHTFAFSHLEQQTVLTLSDIFKK